MTLPLGSPVLRKVLDRIAEASKREEQALEDREVVRKAREEFDEQVRRYLTRWDRQSGVTVPIPHSPLGDK